MVSVPIFLTSKLADKIFTIPLPFLGYNLFNGKNTGSTNLKNSFKDNLNDNQNLIVQGTDVIFALDCDNNRCFCFQSLATTLVDVKSGV